MKKILTILTLFLTVATFAQTKYETPNDFWADVNATKGPAKVEIGKYATMQLPAGYILLNKEDTKKFYAFTRNLYNGQIATLISPKYDWFVTFLPDESGYVKEEKLDADELFDAIKSGEKIGNKERERLGYPKLFLQKWVEKPSFNKETSNLEWATLLKDENNEYVINLNTRILGRRGYMHLIMAVDPETVGEQIAEFHKAISTFEYNDGQKYSEFKEGDKIAKYGMAALITGGTIAVAAKSGLLSKILKPLLIALAAIGAAVKKFWNKIVGKREEK